MKRCYLDSNIILCFIDATSNFHQQSKQIITKLVAEAWEIDLSALSLDECFHNSLRFSKKTKQDALKQLKLSYRKLIKLPNIKLVTRLPELKKHIAVLNMMDKHNLRARDAYHLFIMKTNKIKYFATFDSDFDKVFAIGILKKLNNFD